MLLASATNLIYVVHHSIAIVSNVIFLKIYWFFAKKCPILVSSLAYPSNSFWVLLKLSKNIILLKTMVLLAVLIFLSCSSDSYLSFRMPTQTLWQTSRVSRMWKLSCTCSIIICPILKRKLFNFLRGVPAQLCSKKFWSPTCWVPSCSVMRIAPLKVAKICWLYNVE